MSTPEKTAITFTDDLVLPTRAQRFDALLRPRYWPVNVLALFTGVFLGKLLSGFLFPTLYDPPTGVLDTLGAAAVATVPLVSCGATLLALASVVWAALVPDYSDYPRMKAREAAWAAAIEAEPSLAKDKLLVEENRSEMHRMSDETLAPLVHWLSYTTGGILVDNAAAARTLLERRQARKWFAPWRRQQGGVVLV